MSYNEIVNTTSRHFSTKAVPLIFALILISGIFVLFFLEYSELKSLKNEHFDYLENILSDVESDFSPIQQLVSTSAEFTGSLPLTVNAHESFLKKIFSTSRSRFVYGMGIWYEPDFFNEGQRYFGPYIRFDSPERKSSRITYDWNTPEYNYHETNWYKLLLLSGEDNIIITAPFFDTDYTYITIGRPFFRDGNRAGVVTVDIIFPLLNEFFSDFEFSDFDGVYLTTIDNTLIYSMKTISGSGSEFFNNEKFYNLNVSKWYSKRKRNVTVFDIEGEDKLFKLYGYLDNDRIISELILMHGNRYIFFLIFWGVLFAGFIVYSRMHNQKNKNTQLSKENIQLRDEIQKRKDAEAQLQFLAYHDPVTDLPNINSFFETVPPPRTGKDDRHLIHISLDNIRELSFILERGLIDSLLKDFVGKLISSCPVSSQQFRGNGFTFYVVNTNEKKNDSKSLAERLLKEFSKTILLHTKHVRFRIKIGTAPFCDARSLEHLLNMSQSTLSGSENRKINRVAHYNSEIESRKSFLIALDSEMSRSGFISELRMVYQPVIRMEDRQIAGVEALVRWDSSIFKKTIPPGEFIQVAEENGYIIDLGWFVIKEVLKVLSSSFKDNDWFVSVNVSPLQFIESGFPKKLDRLTASYGVDKRRLKLEITESSAASSVQFFWTSIEQLIKMEFRLALDDFGTGESSLSRLYSYRFDTLKIDRSLIRDIIDNGRNQQIFKSILQLGQVMDNNVIAEGIEQEEEHELLKSFGLKYAQGFLYSKPVSLEELL